MRTLKQKHTNIEFKKFNERFSDEELTFYQSRIRWLTLMQYKFFEISIPNDGHYIFTTTGMYKLDLRTRRFMRIREVAVNPDESSVEKLTYYRPVRYETRKKQFEATQYKKPDGEPAVKMTKEMKKRVEADLQYFTNRELAMEYKCSISTIWSIRKKYEEKFRRNS